MKSRFIVSVPFTGLGLYGGFRGNRWLRNRITVFKEFVVKSLLKQTDQDFVLWISWREEERENQHVQQLYKWLKWNTPWPVVFTYTGVPFWDDKYDDETAYQRLFTTLHNGLPELFDFVSDCDEIQWLLQPSDDIYTIDTIAKMKGVFAKNKDVQAIGHKRGYICNYTTGELKQYNPKTNPPFFAIRFPKTVFFDVREHLKYTGPYKSHEYVVDYLKMHILEERGFLVGTHGENISTHFNHPYGQDVADVSVYKEFGIEKPSIKLPISYRKWLMRKLPHQWQRKLRYIFGELIYSRFYNWIRN